MDRITRRKPEMAVRVRDFSRAHPSADASYAPVLARLEDRVGRMEALAAQQRGGHITTHASVMRRRALRRTLHHELLRHLVTVAEVAAREEPALAERFPMPSTNVANQVFRTAAHALLAQGQATRELLARHGLADTLLDDLAAAVEQYGAAVDEANAGRRDHVGARADLSAVSAEILALVELLDGLNRYRFRTDPARQAA